ncbi:MAG: hypothetical protein IJ682_13100 [Lachnospiraceae bacterium]|nr:hypothetical protein [Lachnospiraceae bacterium]
MKKQYSVSITDGSEVARFLDGIGHKRGVVIEAVMVQHLREHEGYLSPEAAIDAGYKFSERDTKFAKWFCGQRDGALENVFGSGEGKSGFKENRAKNQNKRQAAARAKTVKSVSGIDANEKRRYGGMSDNAEQFRMDEARQDGLPEVKNREMVLAGLSAFMT